MAMVIALHSPSKPNKQNRGLLDMSKSQLRDFASTPRTGLPKRVKKISVASMMKRKPKMDDGPGGAAA